MNKSDPKNPLRGFAPSRDTPNIEELSAIITTDSPDLLAIIKQEGKV